MPEVICRRRLVGAFAALAAANWCLRPAYAQFGGAGGGYSPPAPICPAFTCPSGQKAVGKAEHIPVVSYGCKDSGMNVFNAGSFDPNDPLGSMKQGGKNLNKCCVERDICKQTCGMTSKECHDGFQKCQAKVCKGDQNCQLQGMIADMGGDPYHNPDDLPADKRYDPEMSKCRGYSEAQKNVCRCVAKDDKLSANEEKLKAFYGKHNPEKLDDMGDIKDVDEVWKKWKGKEAQMFVALATKYKDKVVEIKEKPKPAPYEPPPRKDGEADDLPEEYDARDNDKEEEEQPADPPKKHEAEDSLDDEHSKFQKDFEKLETKKAAAKKEEDFDAAGEVKEAMDALRATELERLKVKKAAAVEDENYTEAKKIKARIAKLEL